MQMQLNRVIILFIVVFVSGCSTTTTESTVKYIKYDNNGSIQKQYEETTKTVTDGIIFSPGKSFHLF